MLLQTITEFINESRSIVKRGGRGSKKEAEALCYEKIGSRIFVDFLIDEDMKELDFEEENIKNITSTLCTLFPYSHPERFTPIGLTTMAYIIQAAVEEKYAGGKKCALKRGENPFDYITGSGLESLCSSEEYGRGISTCIAQRGLNMMCSSTGKAKHHTLIHILSQCSIEQGRILCEMMACTLTFGMGIKRFIENLGCKDKDNTHFQIDNTHERTQAALTSLFMTNNLKRVAESLVTGVEAKLQIGFYVSSMLARQKPFHDPTIAFEFIKEDQEEGRTQKKRKLEMKVRDSSSTPFIAQIKIDGYRIQIHKIGGDTNRIWYFSRQGLNLAETYHFNVIDKHLWKFKNDFILDGEIIAMNRKTKEFIACSDMAAFPWLKDEDIILVYFVFDILCIDSKSCMEMKYIDRLRILDGLFNHEDRMGDHTNTPHIIPMIPNKSSSIFSFDLARLVSTGEEVKSYYNEVVDIHGQEGVMLKSYDDPWQPFQRSNAHVKIKPQPQSFDLYIVGANVNKAQIISSVLLAYRSEENQQYYAMCMCGTGLTAKARARLTEWFFEKNRCSTRGGNIVPSHLHVYGGADKPHMYLNDIPSPCTVTAQKLIDSKIYAFGKTLRFPVMRVIPVIDFNAYEEPSKQGNKKWMSESETAMPIEAGFVTRENDILHDIYIWIVPKIPQDESLYSELVRHVLRMGGNFVRDHSKITSEIEQKLYFIIPDGSGKVNSDEFEMAKTDCPNAVALSADWLRNCFLWNRLSPIQEFLVTE